MGLTKSQRRNRIRRRISKSVRGTDQKPRLAVYRSNSHIYAQLINDLQGETLVAASSKDGNFSTDKSTKTEQSIAVGKNLAEKAKALKISSVRFDRGGYLYHGRVKALADGAREAGLKF